MDCVTVPGAMTTAPLAAQRVSNRRHSPMLCGRFVSSAFRARSIASRKPVLKRPSPRNAAGIIGFGSIETESLEQWDEMMKVNLHAPFILLRQALPQLIDRRGAVVNVSSVTGLRAFPNMLSYCVSKAALDQLTRCTALELAPKGIRVNAVNPGVVVSGLHRSAGMDTEAYRKFIEHSQSTHPLGRVGQASEVADLILFLVSPRSGWITGMTCSIDGGRHLTCLR
jgi:NAD(P)-dependent dehydrogenase (short-subunit alcohol dehydrogenase family)